LVFLNCLSCWYVWENATNETTRLNCLVILNQQGCYNNRTLLETGRVQSHQIQKLSYDIFLSNQHTSMGLSVFILFYTSFAEDCWMLISWNSTLNGDVQFFKCFNKQYDPAKTNYNKKFYSSRVIFLKWSWLDFFTVSLKGRVLCFSMLVVMNECFLLILKIKISANPSCRFREKHKNH